jgi:hypothetical protein
MVGRTPWSAADAPVGLPRRDVAISRARSGSGGIIRPCSLFYEPATRFLPLPLLLWLNAGTTRGLGFLGGALVRVTAIASAGVIYVAGNAPQDLPAWFRAWSESASSLERVIVDLACSSRTVAVHFPVTPFMPITSLLKPRQSCVASASHQLAHIGHTDREVIPMSVTQNEIAHFLAIHFHLDHG